VSLRENYGFPRRDVTRIEAALTTHLAELIAAREVLHGEA
jgi:hypothetical protein